MTFTKDPDAVLDYSVDWSLWLAGDQISSSEWMLGGRRGPRKGDRHEYHDQGDGLAARRAGGHHVPRDQPDRDRWRQDGRPHHLRQGGGPLKWTTRIRGQATREVARIAVRLEAETGCPARLLIAQWAMESQWGAKPAGAANYFGIKKASRHEKCCMVTTQRGRGGQEHREGSPVRGLRLPGGVVPRLCVADHARVAVRRRVGAVTGRTATSTR